MQPQARDLAEVIEGYLVRMPIVVPDSGRDERSTGTSAVQKGGASARV